MARSISCVLVLLAACASPQRLSASIYQHEELARALDASGEHASAASQRDQAARERERLGGMESPMTMPGW
jgi:hypothetical protein